MATVKIVTCELPEGAKAKETLRIRYSVTFEPHELGTWFTETVVVGRGPSLTISGTCRAPALPASGETTAELATRNLPDILLCPTPPTDLTTNPYQLHVEPAARTVLAVEVTVTPLAPATGTMSATPARSQG